MLVEEGEETGANRYADVKLGLGHFRHAFNYECLAASFCRNTVSGVSSIIIFPNEQVQNRCLNLVLTQIFNLR